MPDQERDVRPERLLVDVVEVLAERGPARGETDAVGARGRPDRDPGRSPVPASRRSCPTAGVVYPWWRWLARAPSSRTEPSECPCGSTKPGATTRPVTSSTSPTSSRATADRSPIDTIRSPLTPDVSAAAGPAAAVDERPAMEQAGRGGACRDGDTRLTEPARDRPGHRRLGPSADPRRAADILPVPWGYSSAGRAPAWHAGGPGFESP